MNATDTFVAIGIGIAFGFALERAGLGNARKLAGQFLRDFTVVKVMFSAILTAMLGLYWLGRFGAIDSAFLYVPDTYLAPQAVGGLVFGAGFALAGLCPGTSCVSAATGRGDGLATIAGLFAGVLATGLFFSPLAAFYESGGHGAWTLPALFDLPRGVVVFLVVAVALSAFAIVARIEDLRDLQAKAGSRLLSALAVFALTLGVLAAVDGVRTGTHKPAAAVPLVRPHSGC